MLVGILVFDLVDRRFTHSLALPAFIGVGGVFGYFAQLGVNRAGWTEGFRDVLVHVQGPATAIDEDQLMTNWPLLFFKGSDYLGTALGIMVGVGLYFAIFGKFRRGSSLFLHMTLGWFAGFLLLPVLFGIRMTPPRGDNWAGMLGAYAGLVLYCVRNKLWPILTVSLITGTIGGIGFSGVRLPASAVGVIWQCQSRAGPCRRLDRSGSRKRVPISNTFPDRCAQCPSGGGLAVLARNELAQFSGAGLRLRQRRRRDRRHGLARATDRRFGQSNRAALLDRDRGGHRGRPRAFVFEHGEKHRRLDATLRAAFPK